MTNIADRIEQMERTIARQGREIAELRARLWTLEARAVTPAQRYWWADWVRDSGGDRSRIEDVFLRGASR